MTNDPIEEFLANAKQSRRVVVCNQCANDWAIQHWCGSEASRPTVVSEQSTDINKLLALVRIYREANDWIIKQPRDQVHFAGSKARDAEEKALEIVK